MVISIPNFPLSYYDASVEIRKSEIQLNRSYINLSSSEAIRRLQPESDGSRRGVQIVVSELHRIIYFPVGDQNIPKDGVANHYTVNIAPQKLL